MKPKHDLFTPIEEQEKMLREEVLFHQSEVVDESTAAEPKRAPGRAPCPTIKEQRVQALQELPEGFYVCTAGRRKIKRLHLLHQCWMVPGVDYFAYSYAGKSMPPQTDFDEVLSSNTYNKASRLADWTFEGTESMSCKTSILL